MDALRDGLAELGVPDGRVHTEIFGAEGSVTPGVVARSDAVAAPTRRRARVRAAHLVRADRAERALG